MSNRREFITLIGGATAAWPLAAGAQQKVMRTIGVIEPLLASDPEVQLRTKALQQTLSESGWVEGQNLRTDYRWVGLDAARFRSYAREMVSLKPDVILAGSTPMVAALRDETRTLAVPWRLPVDRSTRISCSRSLPTSKSTGRPRLKRCVSNSPRPT